MEIKEKKRENSRKREESKNEKRRKRKKQKEKNYKVKKGRKREWNSYSEKRGRDYRWEGNREKNKEKRGKEKKMYQIVIKRKWEESLIKKDNEKRRKSPYQFAREKLKERGKRNKLPEREKKKEEEKMQSDRNLKRKWKWKYNTTKMSGRARSDIARRVRTTFVSVSQGQF